MCVYLRGGGWGVGGGLREEGIDCLQDKGLNVMMMIDVTLDKF